jgi:Fe-S cluster assembly protein SufB
MSSNPDIDALVSRSYQHGFVTDIESDTAPPGLDESVVRMISRKKREPQFLLDWRLRALAHWRKQTPPHWAHVHYPPIDFNAISY